MSRIEQWIAKLEANEPIDWRKEELLLTLDMLHEAEQFATTLIERDTQADDHYANGPVDDQPAR